MAVGPLLVPGASVAQIEASAARAAGALPAAASPPSPADPKEELRQRAQALAARDPARAALILKGWLEHGDHHA
jgi:flagellar biosynthesis/type III secretory pathway M-ring protein FliF/YscJ